MKRFLSILLLALLMLSLVCPPALAEEAEPETIRVTDDYAYVLKEDGTAEITQYTGKDKKLKIPSQLEGYTVTSFRDRAFYDQRQLTQVEVPDTVKSMGYESFGWCVALTSITLPEGLETMGTNMFWYCSKLTKVNIPDSVQKLGEGVFAGCDALKAITLSPEHPLLAMVDGVLFNTVDSTLLWYPVSRKGKAYTVPDDTKRIGSDAFTHVKLESVVLPESMEELADSAFSACGSLKTIYIPSKVEKLIGAINSCDSLESIAISEKNESLVSVDGVLFEKATNTLLLYPVAKKDKTYTIPEGTEVLAKVAFDSAKFTEIVIPESVRIIGSNAFRFCDRLKTIEIPEGVEQIDSFAFQYCTALTTISLPATLKTVDTNPFLSCEKLAEIVIAEDHPVFTLVNGCLVQREDMTLISYPMGLKEKTLEFPPEIRKIGTEAFCRCKGIQEVAFAEGLVEIGESAFHGCTGLKRVVLPASLVEIDQMAFDLDKLQNTVFVVVRGSFAEEFCTENGLHFVYAE